MMILDVSLEMLGQLIDASGQQRDLYLGRTGIVYGALKLGDDVAFLISATDIRVPLRPTCGHGRASVP